MKKITALILSLFLMTVLSGCNIRQILCQHDYTSTPINATCTENGYILYKCNYCGYEEKKTISPPTGHSPYVKEKGEPSTCLKTGTTDKIVCLVCNEIIREKEILPLREHTPLVEINGYPATCTETGLSDKLVCNVCNKVISEQNVIPVAPHSNQITKSGYAATCTENGLADEIVCTVCGITMQAQTTIPSLGHCDNDYDELCDRCSYPSGKNVIKITDASGLKSIARNLSGVYLLERDVSLGDESWLPVGTSDTPFRGLFYGNGHTISGLNLSNNTVGGLFGYNTGKILNLNLSGVTVKAENANVTIGCFVGVNEGTIKNCNLLSQFTVESTVNKSFSTGYPEYKSKYLNYSSIIGGICGTNNGIISECNVSANTLYKSTNIAKYTFSENKLFYLCNSETFEVISTVYCGGICGINNNAISDCKFDNAFNASVTVKASLGKKYGRCLATTNAFLGSIAGSNTDKITNCTGVPIEEQVSVAEGIIRQINAGGEYGYRSELNYYSVSEYKGLIAENKGTVNGLSY